MSAWFRLVCLGALGVVVSACVEPGSIADPDAILMRIQGRADGGGLSGDAGPGPFPVPGIDAGRDAGNDACGNVLMDYIVPTCGNVACHGSGASSPLDLETSMHAARLIDVEASALCAGEVYIDSDTPEDSLLLTKLGDSPPCGARMPYGAKDPATDAEKACMRAWIDQLIASGAPMMDAGPQAMPDAARPDAGPDCATRDTDNDGTNDCDDLCLNDPDKAAPGLCGCGMGDGDSDNDGVVDCSDGCPNDMAKTAPGQCGCGSAEMNPCVDGCPNDANKTAPGQCGCGNPDTDDDSDGTANCNDGCPNDPDKDATGACGCGTPDTDTDGDGTPDCNDGCPANSDATAAPCGGAGLLVGELPGSFNLAAANNGSGGIDSAGPTLSEVLDLPENTTYVLSGEIYIPASGTLWFYENFDDAVRLAVDGQEILNDETWDAPTTGSITRAEGWYSFELRLGNGVSASGPPDGAIGYGFGYTDIDPAGDGGSPDDPALYSLPRNTDTNTGDLFRVP